MNLITQPAFFIGVDVGGSAIKAGAVSDQGQVLGSVELPTEPWLGQDDGLSRICRAVDVRELAFEVPAARTEICCALLGPAAGFIGAAACARQLVRTPSTRLSGRAG